MAAKLVSIAFSAAVGALAGCRSCRLEVMLLPQRQPRRGIRTRTEPAEAGILAGLAAVLAEGPPLDASAAGAGRHDHPAAPFTTGREPRLDATLVAPGRARGHQLPFPHQASMFGRFLPPRAKGGRIAESSAVSQLRVSAGSMASSTSNNEAWLSALPRSYARATISS